VYGDGSTFYIDNLVGASSMVGTAPPTSPPTPSSVQTQTPTESPTQQPNGTPSPTNSPNTKTPTYVPSKMPTNAPQQIVTPSPTSSPSSRAPTSNPSKAPTNAPQPIVTPSPVSSTPTILFDEFIAPMPWNTSVWLPRLPLSGSVATSGVSSTEALDGFSAKLLYPKNRPEGEWGPRYSTQIMSAEMNLYGHYEARLKSGQANPGEGVISAFFIYRNDEVDYDGDGIIDNHEIDFELLNSDRSSIWCSVYTDYQYIADVENFHRNSARVNIATGEIHATIPGNEGNWDLVEIDPLGWTMPGFDHSSTIYKYGFDWSQEKVSFWIDLEDGMGHLVLFEVLSDGSNGPNDHVPSMAAPTFFNIWHTYVDWWSRADAPQLTKDAIMEIDYVKVSSISSTDRPTVSPTPLPSSSPTTSPPTQNPTKILTESPESNAPTSSPTYSGYCSDRTGRCAIGGNASECGCYSSRRLLLKGSNKYSAVNELRTRRKLAKKTSSPTQSSTPLPTDSPTKATLPPTQAPTKLTPEPTNPPTMPATCECLATALPTASPTSEPSKPPTISPSLPPTLPPTIGCLVKNLVCNPNTPVECCSGVCEQKGHSYRCT